MYESQLIETLQVLRPQEWEAADMYIKMLAPTRKLGQKAHLLFLYIKNIAPDFNDENLDKNIAFAILYPEEAFAKNKLDLVMTVLLKMTREYIVVQQMGFEEDEFSQLLCLCRFYRERSLHHRYQVTYSRLHKLLHTTQLQDKNHYRRIQLLDEEYYFFNAMNSTRRSDLHLPAAIHSLDIAYIVTRLEYTLTMLTQPGLSEAQQLDYQQSLLPIQQLITARQLQDLPLILIFTKAIDLVSNAFENETDYQSFITLLSTHEHLLPLSLKKQLSALVRNYYAALCNKGLKEYLPQLFLLFKEHLAKDYLYFENGIRPSTLQTIANVGLRLQEFEWVHQFLESHRNRIVGTETPSEVYELNLAKYHFAIAQYDKALHYSGTKYSDIFYEIEARWLEIKVYYEQSEIGLFDARLNAFKSFIYDSLRQHKINQAVYERNLNFYKINNQLMALVVGANQKIDKIIQKTNDIPTAERLWLLEKLNALKK